MKVDILTFQEAIEQSGSAKRNLLLGNGFSIACNPIFAYESLFSQAEQTIQEQMPELNKLFSELGIRDFESIIERLNHSLQVLSIYLPDDEMAYQKITRHADELKALLVNTIAKSHPKKLNETKDLKYQACREFLSYFIEYDNPGEIYTFNYDLLLYWTFMNSNCDNGKNFRLKFDDGFRKSAHKHNNIVWDIQNNFDSANKLFVNQNIFHFHGALHFFDTDSGLEKINFRSERKPLIEQIQKALNAKKKPLFVAEGKSDKKLEKINQCIYLVYCFFRFKVLMKDKTSSLFVFGHSLAGNDEHIINEIGEGAITDVFISLHGDLNLENTQNLINKALSLKKMREPSNPLEVHFYDASSAKIWG